MRTIIANTINNIESRIENQSMKELVLRSGGNTGNVCFVDALKAQMNYEEIISCNHIDKYDKKDKDTVFVLPAANWINKDGHVLKDIFLPLKSKDVNLCVLGIGIQMKPGERVKEFVKQLDEDIITSLKIMSEHSKCIGIRGGGTGEVLDFMGIHNWKVIGCPSFYELNREKRNITIIDNGKNNYVFNINKNNATCKPIMSFALRENALLILQGEDDYEKAMEFHYDNISIFYTRELWSQYLKEKEISFSFGTRFHGNMMALSNGIPALWIDYDKRTEEMIEAMQLPHISIDDLSGVHSFRELREHCIYGEKFQKNYIDLWEKYITLLNENGVKHFMGDALWGK